MNIPKWGGRRFRRLLSLYRRQGCVKQLPLEYRMIDTRKKATISTGTVVGWTRFNRPGSEKKRTEYRKQIY